MLITYDPLEKFLRADPQQLRYISHFIIMQAAQAEKLMISLKERINNHYGYPTHEFTGGKVDINGVYTYPEDPPLYPICHITTVDEDIYMYEYDMVAIRDRITDETYVTRVD